MQMKLKAIEISYKSFRYECLLNETFFEIFKQKPDKLHLSFQIKCHENYVLKKHEYRKDNNTIVRQQSRTACTIIWNHSSMVQCMLNML